MRRHANRHMTVRRTRAVESAIPDGAEIRRLRIQKGLTQDELVGRVGSLFKDPTSSGLQERTLRKAEQGRQPCQMKTLMLIARGLGCPVEQIVKFRGDVHWAMMDEVMESAKKGMTHLGEGVLPRLIHALEWAKEGRIVEMEVLLTLAVRRDVMGDPLGALRLGLLLMEESKFVTSELCDRIRVRAASFCDHLGNQRKGLLLLEPIVRRLSSKTPLNNTEWWALFQRGTLLARAAKTNEARPILQRVRNKASADALRTAALHQLGVIDLENYRIDEAEAKFQECLSERLSRSRDDFRIAYEYRRLSEVCEARKDDRGARSYRAKANAILRLWSFKRYSDELSSRSGSTR